MTKELLIVNTGDGKGKITAALGLAMRAAGHGLKVYFIQFIKGSWHYGELDAVKRFADTIDFHVMGDGFTWKSTDKKTKRTLARKGWELAEQAISSQRYHLIVLDELTYPLKYEMIDLETVLGLLSSRPADLHVVVTGRGAPPALIEAADPVTEMQPVKHPLQAGGKAQKGIEF